MSSVGRWYSIRCYKHNGALHRVWDRGLVLENTEDYLVIATKKAKVIEANGRCWFTKEPAVTIFSLDAKLFHDNEIRVLDEKEYLHHKNTYQYSDELDAVLKNQTKIIVERMRNREFPFDDNLINRYFNQYLESTKKE